MKDAKQKIKWILGALTVIICGICYLLMSGSQKREEGLYQSLLETPAPMDKTEENREIFIHICGEVKEPGVYSFTGETRLVQVIEAAGGFTRKASKESVNQAQVVTDGMQIVIANKKKARQEIKQQDESSLININTASMDELMTLSGIGQAKAEQIISYREEYGSFKKKEDIMNISGIKEGVYSKIKDNIKI